MTPALRVLDECKELFLQARGSVVAAMPLLHKIAAESLWSERYSSFGEFCDDCGVSRSQAGRLVKVYQHYVIDGGMQPQAIQGVDADKLYLALSLPGTVDERIERAATLSRGEIKEEIHNAEHGTEHACEEIRVCKVCWKRM